MIQQLANWSSQNWQFVVPVLAVVVAWQLNTRFIGRVKLRFGRANNSFHSVPGTEGALISVYCEKFYVQNAGIKAASNVEISFSRPPTALTTFPPLDHQTVTNPNGEFILKINSISPRELVVVDTIHVNSPTAEIASVRCPEAVGKRVNFWVVRKYRLPANIAILSIMLLGAYYAVYLLLLGIGRIIGW